MKEATSNSTTAEGKDTGSTGTDRDAAFDAAAETVTDAWEGAFIYTSWGYEQTNVTFAQIIDVSDSGKTVLTRLVAAETAKRSNASEHLQPTTEQYGDAFRLHVRNSRGDPAFRGSYPYLNGDMDDSMRLDSFRPFKNTADNTVRQTAPHHRH